MAIERILIMGAGAVGGYYGALLTKAGCDVTFIARGKHLEVMKRNGLKVDSCNGDFKVQVNAIETPSQAKTPDLIIFTVKSYDTEQAAQAIKPIVADQTVILSLQNGVDNDEKIKEIISSSIIIGGMTKIGAAIKEPGVIKHSALGAIDIGMYQTGQESAIQQTEEILSHAGIPTKIVEDINLAKWRKFMWNTTFNVITALTGATYGQVMDEPQIVELGRIVMEEVKEVAAACSVELTDEDIGKNLQYSGRDPTFKTSMLQDVEAGKPIELEAFTGYLIQAGKEHGIATPKNNLLYHLLKLKTTALGIKT